MAEREPVSDSQGGSDVEGIAVRLLGAVKAPPSTVAHVVAVQPCATGLAVLRIHDQSPKSEADAFVLQWSRAVADGVLITGQVLRDEPKLSYNFFPCDPLGRVIEAKAFEAYRRDCLNRTAALVLVVLTSGRGLRPDHPVFRSAAEPILFTDEAGASRCRAIGLPERVRVHVSPCPSAATALAFLKEQTDHGRVSIEAGPTVAAKLHEGGTVDELVLSRYLGRPVSAEETSGLLMSERSLGEGWALQHGPVESEEESGLWSFSRYRVRPRMEPKAARPNSTRETPT